jgi:hypothetical protein
MGYDRAKVERQRMLDKLTEEQKRDKEQEHYEAWLEEWGGLLDEKENYVPLKFEDDEDWIDDDEEYDEWDWDDEEEE